MYSIDQLSSMGDNELRTIASDMGMDHSASIARQDVEYYILDHQAATSAKEMAEKGAGKKKRGRKPKALGEAPQEEKPAADAVSTEAIPKRRGRKPKALKEAEEAARLATAAAATNTEEQAPANEPTINATAVQATDNVQAAIASDPTSAPAEPLAPPKRRGRKPKALKEAMEASANAEQVPTQAEVVAPSPDDAARTNQNTNERKRGRFVANPSESSSLSSFFTPAKKQRNKQRDEQPAPMPGNAPIVLKDPEPDTDKTNKNIKQRNKFSHAQQAPAEAFDFDGMVSCIGVLEIENNGCGFIRSADYNYLSSPDDVYVTNAQIKQYGLKTGDVIEGTIRPPREGEKYYLLCKALRVNGLNPMMVRDRVPFEHLVPLFPDEKFDITSGHTCNVSTRIVDMFAPIGKGQRALIVAPPKTGKTILLKDIANAIAENHPDTYIIMLLIDERPEEVTDMARSVNAEVIASTFDEPADRHVKIAGIVLEKAKRLVECGHDVVIMLDSITRLARAYNTVSPASGKILSGGVDANALQKPKRFFGAARNIENGGSLTIIATALTETSSKMDEVIFEEFKGTGNMELQLDRKLSNKRLFPAVDIIASSTRRDDLLTNPEIINRMWLLRNYIADMNSIEAIEFIKKQMEGTRDNLEILHNMDK